MYSYLEAGKTKQLLSIRKTVELFPVSSIARDSLSLTYEDKGMYSEAVEQFLIDAKLNGVSTENIGKARDAYEKDGWTGFVQQVLEIQLTNQRSILEKDKNAYLRSFAIAANYARLQDKDKTLEYLNKAYDQREPQIIQIKMDPRFKFLRDDPRFKELIKKVGFPE